AIDGSNFTISGSAPVTITGASGNCVAGLSDVVILQLNSPIYSSGTFTVRPQLSVNGGAVIDECGQIIQPASVQFSTVDTVNADFSFVNNMGCRKDTLHFNHNGAHAVNKWHWTINNSNYSTASPSIILPASSTNTIRLAVSNGICQDSISQTIVLDNEVIAGFDIPREICPEDRLDIVNTSSGLIDRWNWNFGQLGNSILESPATLTFLQDNRERNHIFNLVVTNTALNCSDTIRKPLRVVNNCFIAVPTAFTPNGDGLNDYLSPNNAIKADHLQFSVYNRWGQLVFESRDWRRTWDGKIGGIPQASGVYVWYLSFTHRDTGEKIFQKGTVTLIR
ncbi:MAG: gliding motility-associated C-terminal domain-containing protein, partial [Pedobacter sp.]